MSIMELWHTTAQQYFSVFLEMKFDFFGECVVLLTSSNPSSCNNNAKSNNNMATIEKALIGEEGLREKRTTFLDNADLVTYHIYSTLPSGFDSSNNKDDKKENHDDDGSRGDLLYGELTAQGVRELLALLFFTEAKASSPPMTTTTGFVDFGSGTGKICIDMCLLLNKKGEKTDTRKKNEVIDDDEQDRSNVDEDPQLRDGNERNGNGRDDERMIVPVFGIELVKERHHVALRALEALRALAGAGHGRTPTRTFDCSFLNTSFLDLTSQQIATTSGEPEKEESSGGGGGGVDSCCSASRLLFASHFFCCGVAYGENMVESICVELFSQFPNFQCAVVLFASAPPEALLAKYRIELSTGSLDTTWMSNAPAYILRRKK